MKNFGLVLRILLAIVLIGVGVVQIGRSINRSNVEKEAQEQQEQVSVSALKSGYDQLEIGMTYDECVSILGSDGELFSESESEYFGKLQVYLWKPYEDSLFTGIEAHFTNGELTDKTWIEV